MSDTLAVIGALMLWGAVLVRWPTFTGVGGARLIQIGITSLAVGQTLQVVPIYKSLNHLLGNPAGALVVKLTCATLAAAVVRALVGEVWGEGTTIRRDWVLAAVTAAVVTIPVFVDPPGSPSPVLAHVAEFYDTGWRSLVVWLPFLAYLTWALVGCAVMCWRFSHQVPPAPIRTGVRLIGLGCAAGTLYAPAKLAVLVVWHVGGAISQWTRFDAQSQSLILLAACGFNALGVGWEPLWRGRGWAWSAVWWFRLHPLWRTVIELEPELALPVHRHDMRYRLRRVVVEARDGLLVLEERVNPEMVHKAWTLVDDAGLSGARASAAVVGTLLRWAVQAPPQESTGQRIDLPLEQADSLESEVQWLNEVSKFVRSAPPPPLRMEPMALTT